MPAFNSPPVAASAAHALPVPDAFVTAFDGYLAGETPLPDLQAALRTCLKDNLETARPLQQFLDACLDRGQLPPVDYGTLAAELDLACTEDEATDWAEDDTADTPEPPGSDTPPETGTVLNNRYVLGDRLDRRPPERSSSRVFRALDRRRQEAGTRAPTVVVKVVTDGTGRSRELQALLNEAKTGQRLTHPNIVRVFDLDRDGPHTFITLEDLEGESLAQVLDARRWRPMPRLQVLQILEAMCRGLAHAHGQRVVHGDVKPGNVFIPTTGEARLLDFGSGCAKGAGDVPALRGRTPGYASCEVLEGREPTARDDLFSTACVAYRMLAGGRAFGPLTALEAEAAGRRPQRIQALTTSQWQALDRALAFRRDHRQPDLGTFIAELKGPREPARAPGTEQAAGGPAPADTQPHPHGHVRNRRWLLLPAGGLAAALVGSLILWRGMDEVPRPAPVQPATHAPAPAPESPPIPAPVVHQPAPPVPATSVQPDAPVAQHLVQRETPSRSRDDSPAADTPPPAPADTRLTAPIEPPTPPPPGRPRPLPQLPPAAAPLSGPVSAPVPAGSWPAEPGATRTVPPEGTGRSEVAGNTDPAGSAGEPAGWVPMSRLQMTRYVEPTRRDGGQAAGSGWVEVSFTVGRDGRTRDIQVTGSEPPGVYDRISVAAVKRWRFAPVQDPGLPAEPATRVRLRFQPE